MYFLRVPFIALIFSAYFTGGCSTAVDGYSPPDAAPAPPPDAEALSSSLDAAWVPSFCAVGSWELASTYVGGTCTKPFLDFEKNYTVTLVGDRYRVEEENGSEVLVVAHQDAAGTCRASFRELSDTNEDGPVELLFDLTARGEVVTGAATLSLGTSKGACTHTFTVTGGTFFTSGGGK